MIYIHLTYQDGLYCTQQLPEADALEAQAKGYDIVKVREAVWKAWEAHLQEAAVWDTLWHQLANQGRS
jgi:hypothetical protein